MKTVSTVLLTLVVGLWTVDSAPDVIGSRSVSTLKFLFAVCRHGNRGAHRDYDLDPYPLSDPKYYPYGKGALTPKGRVQMHSLGMKIRTLYNGFLNSTFYPEEIYATSTPTERTLMSGQAFLAGLYPPHGFQVWNKDILWQPVPLYSTSPDHAHGIRECQKYLVQLEQARSAYFKEYSSNITEVMDYYKSTTRSNVSNIFNYIWLIWDKLVSESTEGFDLPEWTRRFYPNPLQGIEAKQYVALYANTDSTVRFISGNLVEEMMTTMKKKIDGGLEKRRMQFYSGHDSSIVPLMVALGVPRPAVPIVKPNSALLLELHQDPGTNKHFVKVLFIDGASEELEPQPVSLPDCGEPCDVTTLTNYTSWLCGLDYHQECLVPDFDTTLISRYNWSQ